MSIGRLIIKAQNLIISGLLTELVVRYAFTDLKGWRLATVVVAVCVLFYRLQAAVITALVRGGKK